MDLLTKGILFGVGAVYLTKEKVEEFVNEQIKTRNITPEEGKKLVQETLDKVNDYRVKQQEELMKTLATTLSEMGVATKKDIDALAAKLGHQEYPTATV